MTCFSGIWLSFTKSGYYVFISIKERKVFFMNPDDRPIESPDAAFVSVDSMMRFHQTYCNLTLKSFNNSTLC